MSTDPFAARRADPRSSSMEEQSRLDDAMRRADQLLVDSLRGDERRRHKRLLFFLIGGAVMFASVCLATVFLTGAVTDSATAEKAARLSQEGWRLWQQQSFNAAAAKFEDAVKLDPRNSNAWNGLGWASFNDGDAKRAGEAFQAVIKLEPKHPAALNGLGQMALAAGKYQEAEKYLTKAAAAPDASAAWYGLARLYLLQGKYDEAAKWAKKAATAGDVDGSAQRMLEAAKAKSLPDDLRRAIEPAAAQAATKGDQVDVAKDVGQAWRLMNQGRREEAKELFTTILAKAPQNGAAQNGMGWLLLNSGELDEAKVYFEKVLAAEPLAGGALNGLARVLKAQGDEAGAVKLWQTMVDKIPGVHAGTVGLADVYMEHEEFKKAVPLLEQLASANPGDEQTKQKLARAKAGAAK